jgi:tetratricopeptide (TPR) repeat protein
MLLQSSGYVLPVDLPGAVSTVWWVVGVAIWLALVAGTLRMVLNSATGPFGCWEKGRRMTTTGRFAEAEQCYRKGLALGSKLTPAQRSKLLTCLGGALMDLDRYPESRECLEAALDMGDTTGSSRAGMADCLLLEGADPRRALAWADRALQESPDGLEGALETDPIALQPCADVARAERWAKRAWALALQGRRSESQESIGSALKLALPACGRVSALGAGRGRLVASREGQVGLAAVHWQTGMAHLAMGQSDLARDHFLVATNAAPRSKYADRCRQQLDRLGTSAG